MERVRAARVLSNRSIRDRSWILCSRVRTILIARAPRVEKRFIFRMPRNHQICQLLRFSNKRGWTTRVRVRFRFLTRQFSSKCFKTNRTKRWHNGWVKTVSLCIQRVLDSRVRWRRVQIPHKTHQEVWSTKVCIPKISQVLPIRWGESLPNHP